jgi:hypothetical protein
MRAASSPAACEGFAGHDELVLAGDPMSPAAARATPPQRSIKAWWPLVKQAASAWVADYAPSMGAALSYYSVFSLAPLLLIVISVAGLVFGQDAVRGELFGQLSGLVGADAAHDARAHGRGHRGWHQRGAGAADTLAVVARSPDTWHRWPLGIAAAACSRYSRLRHQ